MSKFLEDKGLENASTFDFAALEEMDPSLGLIILIKCEY